MNQAHTLCPRHFNAISTPLPRCFHAISTPFQRHCHAASTPFFTLLPRHFHAASTPFFTLFHARGDISSPSLMMVMQVPRSAGSVREGRIAAS